jgi:hypothetical protein
MAQCIASSTSKKLLMLNGSLDRETGTMTASEIVRAVVDAVNMRYTAAETNFDVKELITDVVYPKNGGITVDVDALAAMGVAVHECDSIPVPSPSGAKVAHYDTRAFVNFLASELLAP